MEPEWFYKPIEGYNQRYIRVGEFRQIRWCQVHDVQQSGNEPYCKDARAPDIDAEVHDCVIVDRWLEVRWNS